MIQNYLLGLRSQIFPVGDLAASKIWWQNALGIEPYFDQPFYVGFKLCGFELGLDPNAPLENGPTTYWGVEDISSVVDHLITEKATLISGITVVGDGIRVAVLETPEGQRIGLIFNPHYQGEVSH
jgi:predicted enzyme related to lactoylglutathione lyase